MSNSLVLLTPSQMAEADRLTISSGAVDGYGLMKRAGQTIVSELLRRYPHCNGFDVLCGPGNNGGDGYVVARLLVEMGVMVRLFAHGSPRPGSDAEKAVQDCPIGAQSLSQFSVLQGHAIVDAIYGAGLSRPLDDAVSRVAKECRNADVAVISVDLPTGVSGADGQVLGDAFAADLTITFFRLKPGHLLEPGRELCGETIVANIGIPDSVLGPIAPRNWINQPPLWRGDFPKPRRNQHKYSRGHATVFSGGAFSTGAARLAALGAARAGAGATTIYSPASAIAVNAAQLTSIMLAKVDTVDDLEEVISARAPDAFVLGPGFGLRRPIREFAISILQRGGGGTLVMDADAITAFRDEPAALFTAIKGSERAVVLTPHEGEFSRLFPDLIGKVRLERAGEAARVSGAVIVLKGPDTIIASPDGRIAINANGNPWLATAGSGDVLAGVIAGLAAQKMPLWEATCAGVWLHAEAATRFGPGLIADDLPGLLPPLLAELLEVDQLL
ncbi:NAD(P)H-hydrate dehydratase [Aquamicrobium zhengzhouense]|uniref:Bifunctional NAD(P)H-hydrate repair enzyme n=1 Tax=Aquamicrobium zhengzhouense TaxID=2781738 RepID=A0ABS0SBK6_9HYPH|nr:NAD(P)H-hydrate dehydratase [Aquamicrobium zhengzhouense]MBI1620646.1 NAD(P)H-hydrate dehydratase [Aquamicrobium zhengzhouense]